MNKNEYVKIEMAESDGCVTISATLPAINPRRNVPPIRYDLTDARSLAAEKYGNRLLASVGQSPVLENRLRTNVLEGDFVFELTPPPKSPPAKRPKSSRLSAKKTKNTETE